MAVTKKKAAAQKRTASSAVDTAPWIAWGGLGVGLALHVAHLPGGIAWWLAMMIAAWKVRAPELTAKGSMGEAVPANPYEEKLLRRYRARKTTRRALIGLSRDWMPWWPLSLTWILAVLTGLVVCGLPMLAFLPALLRPIEFVAIGLAFTAQAAMRRSATSDPIDPTPQASLGDAVMSLLRGPANQRGPEFAGLGWNVLYRTAWVGCLFLGAGAGYILWVGARWLFPVIVTLPGLGFTVSSPPEPQPAWIPVWAGAGALAVLTLLVTKDARAAWKARVEARAAWKQRFSAKAPKLQVPDLIGHDVVADAIIVDTFQVPAAHSREEYVRLTPSLKDTLGPTTDLHVLPVLDDDGSGGKAESRTQLRMVTWPDSMRPDLEDPGADDDVVGLYAECVMSALTDGEGAPSLVELTRITSEDSPAPAWTSDWAGGSRIGLLKMQSGRIAKLLGAEALIDENQDWLAFGALRDPATTFDPGATGLESDQEMRQVFQDVADSDWWERVWTAALKGKEQQTPTYTPGQAEVLTLPDGTEIHYAAFVTRQGLEPDLYYGREQALSTAIEDAPFVSIQPFPNPKASSRDRAVRHSQAISVVYAKPSRLDPETGEPSPNRIPSTPQQVRPAASGGTGRRGRSAQQMILSAQVANAFRAAKLPVPLVTKVQPLSAHRAPMHVWQMNIQLEASPFSEVQKKLPVLKQAIGAPWLRIESSPEGAHLFAGTMPTPTVVSDHEMWQKTVDLDWGATWVTANIVGSDGATPQLLQADPLPRNEDVVRAVFDLPQTLSPERVKGGKSKLRAARGLAFLEFQTSKANPTQLTILFSEKDPMPFPAPTDWDALAEPSEKYALSFGIGFDGVPREFIPNRDVSLIVQGMSNSGKSVTIQTVIAAAIIQGYLVAVIDPSKGGVDFAFADSWLIAPRAKEHANALATLKALYGEVGARRDLHDQYSVGHWKDLPDEVRRQPILLVIDEFTSLVLPDALPPASKDPAAARARAEVEAQNATRAAIGTLIGRFLREARSVGVSTLLGTQKLDAATLKLIPNATDLKENASRMILGNPSMGALASALKDPYNVPDVGDDAPQGRGRFEPGTGSAELFQGYYATQAELEEFLADEEVTAPEPELILDVEAFMPEGSTTESEEDEESGLLILKGGTSLMASEDEEVEDLDLADLGVELDDLVSETPDVGEVDEAQEAPERLSAEPGLDPVAAPAPDEVPGANVDDTPVQVVGDEMPAGEPETSEPVEELPEFTLIDTEEDESTGVTVEAEVDEGALEPTSVSTNGPEQPSPAGNPFAATAALESPDVEEGNAFSADNPFATPDKSPAHQQGSVAASADNPFATPTAQPPQSAPTENPFE